MSSLPYVQRTFDWGGEMVLAVEENVGTGRLLSLIVNTSDVVETVTYETETWLKFRDETETLS